MYHSEHKGMSGSISTTNLNRASSDHDVEKSTIKRNKKLWPENSLKPKTPEKKEGKIVDWLSL
jgi:hypothetical protein